MSASDKINSEMATPGNSNEESIKFTCMKDIGTRFKKGNTFLAVSSINKNNVIDFLKEVPGYVPYFSKLLGVDITTDQFIQLVKEGKAELTCSPTIIVYKMPSGYLRFDSGFPELISGDGSDGQAVLSHIAPIFDYFSEDDIKEILLNNSNCWIICAYCKDESREKIIKKYKADINSNKI